jgi:hypothetical protein
MQLGRTAMANKDLLLVGIPFKTGDRLLLSLFVIGRSDFFFLAKVFLFGLYLNKMD